MEWVNIIISVLSGLAVCIPLVIELVKYIRKAIQEKNFSNIMKLVLELMVEAEKNFQTGAERKEYVMDSIEKIKSTLGYDVDMKKISEMVDSIIAATKIINAEIVESK